VPLLREIRMGGRQAVGLYYLLTSATRTPRRGTPGSPDCPTADACLPIMVVCYWTLPPNFLIGVGSNVFGSQTSVFRAMPLFRKFRMGSGQAIRLHRLLITTARATSSERRSVVDGGFPFMVVCFRTLPPYFSVAPCRDIFGPQSLVFRGMPLFGYLWMSG